ncbi:hypothetical protein [Sphingomonas sp. PAMC 26621]|uniref:hypothetical protein n=1 Tax=Sphingomonas sp. PAMC 26621 TaxID=1112213 RepID=UPI000288B2B9|nr:hypothetical protein [Sphingomonas sp. PAMC 26621]
MKKITLYGAAVRNDGGYVDAGATLEIGDNPEQISAECAKALVGIRVAVSETAALAVAKDAAE